MSANKSVVVFEVKGAKSKNLFEKQNREKSGFESPVQQTWRYMSAQDPPITYGICTNYRTFILFDSRRGYSKWYEFDFYDIGKEDGSLNRDKLREFIGVFSRQSIIDKSFLETLYTETDKEENAFSDEFYTIFKETRLMLIKEFKECINIAETDAIKFAQIILNRIVFIFFAESTEKVPKRMLQEEIRNTLKQNQLLIFQTDASIVFNYIQGVFKRFYEGATYPVEIPPFNGDFFKEI